MFFASINGIKKIPDRSELRTTNIPGYFYIILHNAFKFPLSFLLLCRYSLHPLKKLYVSDLVLNNVSFLFFNRHWRMPWYFSQLSLVSELYQQCGLLFLLMSHGIHWGWHILQWYIYSWNLYLLHAHQPNEFHIFSDLFCRQDIYFL